MKSIVQFFINPSTSTYLAVSNDIQPLSVQKVNGQTYLYAIQSNVASITVNVEIYAFRTYDTLPDLSPGMYLGSLDQYGTMMHYFLKWK